MKNFEKELQVLLILQDVLSRNSAACLSPWVGPTGPGPLRDQRAEIMSGAAGSTFESALPTSTRRAGGFEDATERVGHCWMRYGYGRLHILLRREG